MNFKDDTIEVSGFLERLNLIEYEDKQIKSMLEKLEKRVTSLELWNELNQQAKDSIAKVVDTIATKYPEYDEFAHNPETYIPFLKDVVEHGLLLLFCKRSLEAIYWLFLNDGEISDDQYELSEDDTQRAHMHITHSLNQLFPDKPKCQNIFLMLFNDKTFLNCFAKTTAEFDENTKLASVSVRLHKSIIDYWKTNPIEGRAFAIWNISHEFVNVLCTLQFGSTQLVNIEKLTAYLPTSQRLESGFVWDSFVIGAYPFPVCEKPLQISRILIDFYTINANSLRKKNKLRGIELYQSSQIETEIPIGKARSEWYEEFGRGIDADVFLESSNVPFIEEVLPQDQANEFQIQSLRFRSSYIINPHIRF